MIRVSKTGLGFICLFCVLYLATMQTRSGLLLMILGLILACFVLNALGARFSVAGIKLIPPAVLCGTEGEAIRGSWRVENTAKSAIGLVKVIGPWGTLLRVPVVEPGSSLQITPDLHMASRGAYAFSMLTIESAFPLGLISWRRRLKLAGELVVYPRVYECVPPAAAGFEPMVGGRFAGHHRSHCGDSFHGIRAIQPGDPFKLIHWPSTSKGREIMVKEFDEELSGRVAVILDCSAGTAPNGEPLINWAARAAGSLILSAQNAGHQVEFLATSDLQMNSSFPPFADADAVLEVLARVRTGTISGDKLARAVDALPSRAALCFVTGNGGKDMVRCIQQQMAGRRKVAVYAPDYLQDSSLAGARAYNHDRILEQS